MNPIDSPANGGAAPADRQCQFTRSNGFRCRDWALRGHQHCFRHHQYLHSRPENPIDVPLLEDEDSLASLLSQTLRALAWGTIPANNGRAILAGCRIMQGILTHRLAMGKFHVKLLRLGMPEAAAELLDREPPAQPPTESEPEPESVPEPVTCNPSPVNSHPPPRFPSLRKEWDQSLRRSEEELMELVLTECNKTPGPFGARRVPFTAPTPEQLAQLAAAQGSLAR
jgi:hypothetical protein